MEKIKAAGNGGNAAGQEIEFSGIESKGVGRVDSENPISVLFMDQRPGTTGSNNYDTVKIPKQI